jgi:hypothetical protein
MDASGRAPSTAATRVGAPSRARRTRKAGRRTPSRGRMTTRQSGCIRSARRVRGPACAAS